MSRLKGSFALAAALAATSAARAADVEHWGAYDVAHYALPGVASDPIRLKDGTIVVNAREGTLYFLKPDGRIVAQLPTDLPERQGELQMTLRPSRESPAVLRDGTIAVIVPDPNHDAGTVLFVSPDGGKRGVYATDGKPWALTALRGGGAAVLVGSKAQPWQARSAVQTLRNVGVPFAEAAYSGVVFLDSAGKPKGRIPPSAFGLPPEGSKGRIYPDSDILELSDGRLLATTLFGTYIVSKDRREVRTWVHGGMKPVAVLKNGLVVSQKSSIVVANKIVDCRLALADSDGRIAVDLGLDCGNDKGLISKGAVGLPGGRVALATSGGYIYVFGGDGRERWHFKASGGFYGAPIELSNGVIVAASEDHRVYFLSAEGRLLGAYKAETALMSRPIALEDGGVVVFTNGNFDASHNMHVFTPTGRPFASPESSSGRWCRVVGQQTLPTRTRAASCEDREALLDPPGEAPRMYGAMCLQFYPDSRATNFKVAECRSVGPVTKATIAFDCEVCSDKAPDLTPQTPEGSKPELPVAPLLR